MKTPIFQVDAFASSVFGGNPAAVCPLDDWLPDDVMQSIAAENNLAETAFFVPENSGYRIRWFTPKNEVDLCGHATLASAYVLFQCLGIDQARVNFASRSGSLTVTADGDLLSLDFPALKPKPLTSPNPGLPQALGCQPGEMLEAIYRLAIYETEDQVRQLRPDMAALARVEPKGVIVTAKGKDVDFVSRFFAPAQGIPEDPVTGSAHCMLIPYWSQKLGRHSLLAHQISERGGELHCEDRGDRVNIAGRAVLYLEGSIYF